ncbi:MAG TPA: class I SAM-dependent methyltransferase [Actinomycetota bacterium]|nr:class I SAM-dependent methyltransferase [Actinomycetota bacterium]
MDQDPATYGERIAGIYDEVWGGILDTDAAVDCIAELAGSGPILELGIGTGRLAIPLTRRGVDVHGIDASEAMVARLREKPGGEGIPVTMANFRDVPVDGTYPLILVAFNTIFALTTQEDQVRCFEAVAARLSPGGMFVVEAFVPDPARFVEHQTTRTMRVEDDRVMLQASRHDPVGQRVDSQHILVAEEGIRLYPVQLRYSWPAELDLMARLAGLILRDRWGGWDRRPFDSESTGHVSVYIRP